MLPQSCMICGVSPDQRREELKPRIERLLAVYEGALAADDLASQRALETQLRYFGAYPLQPQDLKRKRSKTTR